MDLGKFPPQLLERLLATEGKHDPRLVLGPKLGEDAAAIDMGDRLLIAKSDPITFATDEIGWYAVQVNANDIACTGGVPMWFLATLLAPETFSEAEAEALYGQVLAACTDLDIALIGGHSEVTYGIDRPLVMGSMLGEVEKDKLVRTGGAQEGDSIVITKGVAVEGTAVLAREFGSRLLECGMTQSSLEAAREYLYRPGISVVPEARIACAVAEVHSMHDPTEGGVVTGLREIARASGMGLAVEQSSIPVLPQCEEICRLFNLNPLGLLASGCLIIALPSAQVPTLLRALEEASINAWEVGQVISPEEGLVMIGYEGEVPLPEFSRDELARYISQNVT
ncbi:MAG: AIR synthase family protein [Chloroflexota bacterium]|nr:AIR synthase family protein [Chloroflexota bacterium]